MKQLEEENRELKQLVADLSFDTDMLQDVLSKRRETSGTCGVWSGICSIQGERTLRREGAGREPLNCSLPADAKFENGVLVKQPDKSTSGDTHAA